MKTWLTTLVLVSMPFAHADDTYNFYFQKKPGEASTTTRATAAEDDKSTPQADPVELESDLNSELDVPESTPAPAAAGAKSVEVSTSGSPIVVRTSAPRNDDLRWNERYKPWYASLGIINYTYGNDGDYYPRTDFHAIGAQFGHRFNRHLELEGEFSFAASTTPNTTQLACFMSGSVDCSDATPVTTAGVPIKNNMYTIAFGYTPISVNVYGTAIFEVTGKTGFSHNSLEDNHYGNYVTPFLEIKAGFSLPNGFAVNGFLRKYYSELFYSATGFQFAEDPLSVNGLMASYEF